MYHMPLQIAKLEGMLPVLKDQGDKTDETSGVTSSDTKSSEQRAAEALLKAKEQLSLLFGLLDQALGASESIREEAAVASTSEALHKVLHRLTPTGDEAAGGLGEEDRVLLESLVEGWEGSRLLRLMLSLQPKERKQVVDSVQRVANDLLGQAVDVEALLSGLDNLAVPSGKSTKLPLPSMVSPLAPLSADVFGFKPVPEEILERIARGVGRLEVQLRALEELSLNEGDSQALSGEALF